MSTFDERLRRALAPNYTLERELESGGMGTVFLGHDVRLDKPIAIKTPRLEATAADIARFRREASILAGFRHAHIVPVHVSGDADGIPYYIMDYLAGETVADRLARGPLPPAEARQLGLDLLAALAEAHRRGVVHRDVKPSNVFLDEGGAVLTDFGIARSVTSDHTTAPNELRGTFAYMSPEQLANAEVGPPADLFAAALVIREAHTARRWSIFDPKGPDWTGVPAPVARVLQRALQSSPTDRWGSAKEFRVALRRAGRGWRQGWVQWSVGVGAVAVAALVVYGVMRRPPDHPTAAIPDLAIYPFEVEQEVDPSLGRDLMIVAAHDLEQFPRLSLVPKEVTSRWSEHRTTARPPARYRAEGTAGRQGDSIEVRLVLRDSTGIHDTWTVRGGVDKAALGARVATELLRRVKPDLWREYVPPTDLANLNLPALDAYLNGEDEFARDHWAKAEVDFASALRLDPSFARSAWRLENVQGWRRVRSTVDLSWWLRHYRNRLSARDRLLIQAQLTPHGRSRYAVYEQALDSFPQDAYVLLLYGAEVFHRGPLAGLPLTRAVLLLEESVSRNPTLAPAEDQLVWGLIRLGERTKAESALVRLQRNRVVDSLSDVDPPTGLQAALQARFHPEEFDRWAQALPGLPDPPLVKTARLALSLDIPNAERILGEKLAAHGSDRPARANGHEAQGLALVALGRGLDALQHFDSAATLFGTPEARLQSAEWRVVPTALELWDPPDAERSAGRAALEPLARGAGPVAVRAAWALALDAVAVGDTASALRWRAIVRARGRSGGSAARLDALLEARAAARQDYQEALRRSDALLADDALQPGTERLLLGDPFARTALHVLRGTWYERLGQHARADTSWLWYENSDFEGWLATEAQAAEVDWAFSAQARIRRADLALARGDTLAGCPFVRRVRELWSTPDASTRAAADRARQLLASCP